MSSFKERHPFEQRCNESKRIREKYADRIPIIVEVAKRSSLPPLDKCKYLVPQDLTVGQFVYVIRKSYHRPQAYAVVSTPSKKTRMVFCT
jgi:GABA(A) receptor-associated protein